MIRAEKILFDLLVQEKVGTSKNDRFDADFKTLADVLIQEVAKHDLEHKVSMMMMMMMIISIVCDKTWR